MRDEGFSAEWLRAHYAKMGKAVPEDIEKQLRRMKDGPAGADQAKMPAPKEGKRRKYGNEPTERGGIRFDSRHEADVWDQLTARVQAGEALAVIRQVPFPLPGGVKYIADFVTLEKDGKFRVMDAKSPATRKNAVYRLKKKQMKNCLGLEIEEV